ncbi:MAG: O-succinylhomoserine sulfhydrylase [Rhodospirillales bacterium]
MSDAPPREESWRTATRLVRGGIERSRFDETSEALYLTSGYVYGSAEEAQRAFKGEDKRYIYSRYANPTLTMFETRLAMLEGAEVCVATASGMAAVFAALASQLKAGDRVVASRALFGSCHYIISELLPCYGIETVLVDGTDLDQWKAALGQRTHCVFLETPSNPALEIIDLKAVCDLSHDAGACVIVDNVFATPILQKPFLFGADIVMYSATKHIDGQGRTLGGAILTNDLDFVDTYLTPFMRHTGPSLSPFNAWVLLKGLETLDLRVRQHCRNTHQVVRFLAARKGLARVLFPGLEDHPQYDLAKAQMEDSGTIVAFEIEGGKEAAFNFLNALKLIDMSNNLGDAKSLITHPATTTHQRLGADERAHLGITPGLVRLSVGLEDPEDVIEDLDQALTAARR